MSFERRHGKPEDPIVRTAMGDPVVSPDAIPPIPSPPAISPTAGVAELRQLLIEFSRSMYKAMAALPGAIRALDSRTGLLRRLLIVLLITLVLDIGMSVVIGVVLYNQGKTQAQLQAVVSQLGHVVHGNCYELGLIIPNYHKGDSVQRLSYPGGPASYDQLYIGMQNWGDEIGCGIKHSVPGT